MSSPPDYRALYLQEREERRRAEEERDRERERTRNTTFLEFLGLCHHLFSVPLRVGIPHLSTKGSINRPIGKACPLQFLKWDSCDAEQQRIYNSVCTYLQPFGEPAPRLFASRHALDHFGEVFRARALSSEKDLEGYERFGVEDHVHKIISELCKIPGAQEEFDLGDGVWFDNHGNDLDSTGDNTRDLDSDGYPSRPDQFCIHRVNGQSTHLLTTVEYKPPHKLSVENLRCALKNPINFWEEIVNVDSVPKEGKDKLVHNAYVLTGSAIVQEYHVMLQEGLEYSYLTNGLAVVLLRVPRDTPEVVYYHMCEPNEDIKPATAHLQKPLTTIARVLCLCLMSFRSPIRDQTWRQFARARVPEWTTSFDHTRSQIPDEELRQNPPDSEYTSSESVGAPTISEYMPSSSSFEEVAGESQILTRASTRSRAQCRPNTEGSSDPPDADEDPDAGPSGRKRGFSELTTSSSSQSAQSPRQTTGSRQTGGSPYQHNAQFCTQKCLLGLKQGDKLDENCPNVALHRKNGDGDHHLIDAKTLVQLINEQLDKNLDIDCTPMGNCGECGATGAPFKITCTEYGYTVVGKGTTTHLWGVVSREAEIYRFLKQAQGSAIPVFLGTIDLAMTYYLHGAGRIRHMLLMGWAGEHIDEENVDRTVRREVSKSKKEIRSLGLLHGDLRWQNILWNAELNRALIIDFDASQMDPRLAKKQPKQLKRKPSRPKGALSEKINHGEVKSERKRLRVL
ncbi:TPA_exp: Uncharacterized protein A8136_6881 [Trichophyton benhamiae CBS 112371]|uniref:Aminoglycoside phosphotransferase domain-containing protein n=1 Tax=Arthroderma benhamiae (strain ATCC MYA-4681 / CBS 112371) TaxID=663331 RepID=D4AS83_ARTBC|nr:uncharacterized protein ARB_07098 [Trichophyton benhamiae CBS 112371]EFE34147.1 hypothetical protein ARB_07098 [Trichophyton benhamiae CBS 112371]DAA77115.1 TPA_exp: Uncharacterized protein A8136_6881 [Trichophyton benhamiae CBS 112371]